MQSFEVEYLVSDLLDGTTPSPVFIPENLAPSGPTVPEDLEDVALADDDNIYRFEVTNLGLIDPDFGIGGSFADRFLVGLWINSPVAGGAASTIAVLSTRTREIVQEFVVPSLNGETNFYREECIFVPQGSVLGLNGFDASADPDDILVRLHIKCADTLEDYALLLESCCCTEAAVCTVPEVTDVQPSSPVACSGPPGSNIVTVTGGPFDTTTTVQLTNTSCGVGESLSISNLLINSATELQFQADCDGTCTTDFIVSNGPGCDTLVSPGFSTTPT